MQTNYKLMEPENTKKITKKDFDEAVETYMVSIQDIQLLDRKFFDFKIAFAGFLGVILTILFSNSNNPLLLNKCFLYSFVAITIAAFISVFSEIWHEATKKDANLKESERYTILTNIRHNASMDMTLTKYGVEAGRILSNENPIFQAMKEGKLVADIIKEFSDKHKWKLYMLWWGILFLSIPIIFLIEIIYLK